MKTLYAWVGEDEYGSGQVGIKQALLNGAIVPLVSSDLDKVRTPEIVGQLQAQASRYQKPIRLARFDCVQAALILLRPYDDPRRS